MAMTRGRVLGAVAVFAFVLALVGGLWPRAARPDLDDRARIAAGAPLYAKYCASCHGPELQGQPNWKVPLANGRMPAPPHDDRGHTWHHASDVLFALTKHGMKPPYAPAGYESDMPAFAGAMSDDEIWSVLAFIRSRWSERVRRRHAEVDRGQASR